MSELKPYHWNAVVAGRWNPAILTPKGIATHIFKKEGDVPFEVLVPLDAFQDPAKIKIDGLFAQASFERLAIDCERPEWNSFDRARQYCCNAMDALPVTPLIAAGFNLRYKLKDPGTSFISSLDLPLDNKISDQRMDIEGRQINRSIKWNNGSINLQVLTNRVDTYEILLNFDRKSADNNILKKWLKIPIDEVKAVSTTILCDVLEACTQEELECLTQPNP